jgi:thiamine biosynthesis protein ThiS
MNNCNDQLPVVLYLNINGKLYKLVSSYKISLSHLIIFLGYKLNLVAVEYNGKIININHWDKTYIKNNISIEIVTIVGGG